MIIVSHLTGVQRAYTGEKDWRHISDEPITKTGEHEKEKQRREKEGEKKKKKKVDQLASEIMRHTPLSLGLDTTLDEAWEMIKEHKIEHLPILSHEGKVVGLLSETDLMKELLKKEKGGKKQIKDIMQKHVLCATPDTDMKTIAKVFFDEKVKAMPIVDKDSKLVGILTDHEVMDTIMKVASLAPWG